MLNPERHPTTRQGSLLQLPLRRCLIVDDHPLMREAMAGLVRDLEPQAELVTAGSVAEALRLSTCEDFGALIVDLNLPDGDGAELVAEFRHRWPALPILVLTASEDHLQVRRLMAAGATGFTPKSAPHATLLAALRLVLAGQTYLPPLLLNTAAPLLDPVPLAPMTPGALSGQAPTHVRPVALTERLTPRQVEVLRLVCGGLSNKHISRQLGLAERTIKVHVGAIFRALGVSNRTQAALAARAAGLID